MTAKLKYTLDKTLPWILLIGGIIGVLSAGVLTVEKVELLQNPNSKLGCDFNPIVACGPVINTAQASAFGFLNPIIGLAGFSVVATVGAAMLAGATFKRWFWQGLQLGMIFAVAFVTWLQYETIYDIKALCPYCMVVWSVTIPMFWYTTLYNLRQGHIRLPAKLKSITDFAQRHHADILTTWFLIIIGIILYQFWHYWQTLI